MELFRHCCPEDLSRVYCAIDVMEEIEKWLYKHNHFTVLVTGKMGTGKTTLVMGLNGTVPNTSSSDTLLPHTVNVTPYTKEHKRVNFTFYDTPGLKDSVGGENDWKYLKQMRMPDVLIFTMKMDDSEFRQEDIDTIKNISHAFGWKVWERALFLLTFANVVSKPGENVGVRENQVYYNRRRDDFALKVTETLNELNAETTVANTIPVLPVGLVKQPIIPSDVQKLSWVKEFWKLVFAILKSSREVSSDEEVAPAVEEGDAKHSEL